MVYVAGAGRSGSTILAQLLASSRDLASVGELQNVSRVALSSTETCSCGEPPQKCPFWCEALARWRAACGPEVVREHDWLRARQEEFRAVRPWLRSLVTGNEFASYARVTRGLIQAITETARVQYVLDISKTPLRLRQMGRAGVPTFCVHLVRSPYAVAASLSRPWSAGEALGVERDLPGRRPARTALFWLVVNLQTEMVSRQGNTKRTLLRYEDLVVDWEAAIRGIGQSLGLAISGQLPCDEDRAHLIAGNRVRFRPVRAVRDPSNWRELLSDTETRQVKVLSYPLLRRYGYCDADASL